jgi:hypothetical protein
MVNNPGAVAGQFAGLPGAITQRLNKASATVITKGILARLDRTTDPYSWIPTVADADEQGPFCVPVETKGAGTLEFSTRWNDVFYLTADGVIQPGQGVQASTATVGQVVAMVETTIDQTPGQAELVAAQDDSKRLVGVCLGKADNWNTGAPTKCADGDLVAVYIPLGVSG